MTSVTSLDRRHDLDWIRVGAFFLLILYHTGMFYVPWDWHVKTPHPVEALEPLMQLTNPWRLTLLFLVSGAATRFMADRTSVGRLTTSRIARLLPPLLFAMFVIVPPQSYYEIVEHVAANPGAPVAVDSYGVFWRKYATASGNWCDQGECLITPTWNHMWFVAYLLVYSLVLALMLLVLPKLGDRLQGGLERSLKGAGLLIWPVVFLAVMRIFLMPRFEITHDLIEDWYNHAVSFSAFLLGFGLAKSEVLKVRLINARWTALTLAILCWAGWASYAWIYRADDANPPEALRIVMRCVYATDQWCAIAAILGFGAKHLSDKGGPVLRYLTLGVFPFYIVHQTLIVVMAHNLAKLGLPQALEGAILVAATFAGCFATYEIVRRIPGVRALFGLKGQPAAAPASRPPAVA
ncbi:acetyltransferase [Caulobacter vibrioides]|uniref:Acetyltransferase n=1 Tax=Caulobacter vibrioides TaxID=155892 RepID=A0A290MHZ0_CAUVI|nr:acyltransferase family protein [Caulobacter vibrioides]ATC31636.1 acetyltransferase [Caulobacter vibrioides]